MSLSLSLCSMATVSDTNKGLHVCMGRAGELGIHNTVFPRCAAYHKLRVPPVWPRLQRNSVVMLLSVSSPKQNVIQNVLVCARPTPPIETIVFLSGAWDPSAECASRTSDTRRMVACAPIAVSVVVVLILL